MFAKTARVLRAGSPGTVHVRRPHEPPAPPAPLPSATAPHFVLLLALAFDTMFLFMESRRYQIYDLWRRRVQWLNRYYISPALSSSIGYRIQRNYGYLFGVALLAWMLKLSMHPQSGEPEVVLERARVGILPGATVVALVVAFVLGAALLALRAPSDKMVGWEEAPSRLRRWRERRRPPPGKEREGDDVPPLPLEH